VKKTTMLTWAFYYTQRNNELSTSKQGGHKVREKIPRAFHARPDPQSYFSRGYRNENFGNLAAFMAILAIFSPRICRNGYFS